MRYWTGHEPEPGNGGPAIAPAAAPDTPGSTAAALLALAAELHGLRVDRERRFTWTVWTIAGSCAVTTLTLWVLLWWQP